MTLSLPDPRIDQLAWDDEREGVQRNFDAIKLAFPLENSTEHFRQVPQCRAKRTSDVNHATSGTWQSVLLNGEDYDLGAPIVAGAQTEHHSTSANTDRLVCRVPGLYAITANVAFAVSGTGSRGLRIMHSGGQVIAEIENRGVTADAVFAQLSTSGQYRLAVAEYVYMEAFQTSTAALAMKAQATNATTCLAFHWVSP